MKLNRVDRLILDSYAQMIDGLANYLGIGFEIVLHSLQDYSHSVIKIINGHYSNRSVGAPITDIALDMLAKVEHNQNKSKPYISYFNKNSKGTILKSSTIPISGENSRIIGLLCINFYTDIPLFEALNTFMPISKESYNAHETFADNAEEILVKELNDAKIRVYNDPSIQSINQNKEILSILYTKGIFNLKDAVSRVSASLGITKNTVYLHIRNFSKHNKK